MSSMSAGVDGPRAPELKAGTFIAVLSALTFGVTTPLIARFGHATGPLTTASLLYAGAFLSTVGRVLPRKPGGARLELRHVGRLALVSLFGAALAPTLFAWGLQRSGALTGSLLLNTEAGFTVLLAWRFYREPITKRLLLALALMTLGGVVLALRSSGRVQITERLGLLALVLAPLCWALDNTLTRAFTAHDSSQIVATKSVFGAALTALAAWLVHEPTPSLQPAFALLVCGVFGYGTSLRLYLAAQRSLGAARTASIFALAPFAGALCAVALGERGPLGSALVAGTLFAAGIALHFHERFHHDPARDCPARRSP
jgi:drug/metabolite transporter (DMT)-like permease